VSERIIRISSSLFIDRSLYIEQELITVFFVCQYSPKIQFVQVEISVFRNKKYLSSKKSNAISSFFQIIYRQNWLFI